MCTYLRTHVLHFIYTQPFFSLPLKIASILALEESFRVYLTRIRFGTQGRSLLFRLCIELVYYRRGACICAALLMMEVIRYVGA